MIIFLANDLWTGIPKAAVISKPGKSNSGFISSSRFAISGEHGVIKTNLKSPQHARKFSKVFVNKELSEG